MTDNDFFQSFENNRWSLTIMDETDESQPVLQVGLVATFYLVDAYIPTRRKEIIKAFELYCQHFGSKLKWGYLGGEEMVQQEYSSQTVQDCINFANHDGFYEPLAFRWSSRKGFRHASSYMFGVFSPAGWFEQIHNSLTTVRFYLPVEELREFGNEKLQSLIKDMCNLLRPIHGAAGLGIQHCYEWENYQHMEYQLTLEYRGIDLCIPSGNGEWRKGYSNLNWYTYIAHHWIKKLGTTEELIKEFDDIRINVLPYEWGTIIRAGEWPALGKTDTDPRPELYVKINEALRPLRINDIGSLHYGSIAGEMRFNKRTSNLWLRRFDLPPGSPKIATPKHYRRFTSAERHRRNEDGRISDGLDI